MSYNSAISFLDIYGKELRIESQTDICTLMFIVLLFTTVKK